MNLKVDVNCPNCGAWMRTHDLSEVPGIKRRIKVAQRNKALKFASDARKEGLKVRGVRPENFDVEAEELGDDAVAFLRGFGKRLLSSGEETVYHSCGGVVSYERDDSQPFGLALRDKTPEEKRKKPKDKSDGPGTPPS